MLEEFDGPKYTITIPLTDAAVTVLANCELKIRDGLAGVQCIGSGQPQVTVLLSVPLGDSVAYWHPTGRWGRPLPPDGFFHTSITSLNSSVPLGCVYQHSGRSTLGFALDRMIDETKIQYGVLEEEATFLIRIDWNGFRLGETTDIALVNGLTMVETLDYLKQWCISKITIPLLAVPAAATEPVYSTWYSFHAEVSEAAVAAEARLASSLGCRTLFLDFGWQVNADGRRFEGCGDWVPDTERFPDLMKFVDELHDHGMATVCWIGPLLLGRKSSVFMKLSRFAPHYIPVLDAYILDPRYEEVRNFIIESCLKLIEDFHLDGLKIDFLDTAMEYAGTSSAGDIHDVGEATRLLLSDLIGQLRLRGRDDVMIEFRQPYVSPAMAAYANIVRAGDCAGDAVTNRTSIIDARFTTPQPVHSDMMMWDHSLDGAAVARHLHSSLFGTPQISVLLQRATEEQLAAVRSWIRLWNTLKPTTLGGALLPSLAHSNYPIVRAMDANRARSVAVIYEPGFVAPVDDVSEMVVVNATTEETVVVDIQGSGNYVATAYDIHGVTAATHRVSAGVSRLMVPQSGWLSLRPAGDS
ncbi:glycoside hydrolase family 36 protein [Psychromicrobium xiongbiense]|uniref:glycoside hydrolase family 36 protein n=1 Tax=Psychromicrobium xiongbiense TaxID=3051184 RepID=UPI0025547AAF|nr:glycoside hydrolase family 36 protein [Psychromicrobium sp. YIM S02556]